MASRRERLESELRKLLATGTFFAIACSLAVFTDKLLVTGPQGNAATYVAAILAGLVIAKVLILVDMLPFMETPSDRPLVYSIVRKTPIYVGIFLAFRYVERLIHHLVAGAPLAEANALALQRFTQPLFWATGIWILVLLLVFLATRELSRALGADRMRLMFFGR